MSTAQDYSNDIEDAIENKQSGRAQDLIKRGIELFPENAALQEMKRFLPHLKFIDVLLELI